MARRLDRTAFLLDTFEGFSKADLQGIDAGQKMQFADTSLDAVRAVVGEENVQFVKGYFPESASQLPDTSYCLVHIDCDLYAPILSALNYFYPRLVPGGFLIVHDYLSLAWDGAERAVDEFFADKPESIIPLTDGAGSVVIRKARSHATELGWLDRKRLALFSDQWTPAGKGHLTECLGFGWGGQEDWGIWGIGPRHELTIYTAGRPDHDLVLEVDVHAPVLLTTQEHCVDVLVEGATVASFTFTVDNNRAPRQVRIPREIVSDDPVAAVRIEFVPHQTIRPADYNPDTRDVRELSMALHRLRRGQA